MGRDRKCVQPTQQDNHMRLLRECNGRDPGQRVSMGDGRSCTSAIQVYIQNREHMYKKKIITWDQ